MPAEKYNNRCFTLYFPTKEEYDRVLQAAEKATIPLSKYCIEMIRLGMDRPIEPPPGLQDFREDLALAKSELTERDAHIRDLEAELFTARQAILNQPESEGKGEFSSKLIDILGSGRVMKPAEIMRSLGIDNRDIEAVQALANQLHALQDLRLISEGKNGWKWIG